MFYFPKDETQIRKTEDIGTGEIQTNSFNQNKSHCQEITLFKKILISEQISFDGNLEKMWEIKNTKYFLVFTVSVTIFAQKDDIQT